MFDRLFRGGCRDSAAGTDKLAPFVPASFSRSGHVDTRRYPPLLPGKATGADHACLQPVCNTAQLLPIRGRTPAVPADDALTRIWGVAGHAFGIQPQGGGAPGGAHPGLRVGLLDPW
jgi:hypothetical protein